MNKALRYMFWGYLFIFFRFNIVIDLLADPIGYLFIVSACSSLIATYPHAAKARSVALLGAVISIPGVFINLSEPTLGNWELYSFLLLALKLIVAYYLFAVLKSIVTDFDNSILIARTRRVFNFYLAAHLLALGLHSFSMNVSGDYWVMTLVTSGIFVVVMDIAFLLLIGAIRRKEPDFQQKQRAVFIEVKQ